MAKQMVRLCSIVLVLLGIGILGNVDISKAAVRSDYVNCNGFREIDGVRYATHTTGIQVRIKEESAKTPTVLAYGIDTWLQKENGTWSYLESDLNSDIKGFKGSMKSHLTSEVSIWLMSTNAERFGFFPDLFKKHISQELPEEYAVVCTRYQAGKVVNRYAQNTSQTMDELNKKPDSLIYRLKYQPQQYYEFGSYDKDSVSYDYVIYPAYEISTSGKTVSADVGECTLRTPGKIFYNGDQYVIASLPQIDAPTGYTLQVDGWYDSKSGGAKYLTGSTICEGTVLYPHYTLTKKKSTINCVDVVEKNTSTILGKQTWMQEYGTTVSGSTAGALPVADAYYKGMQYVGCSTQIVHTDEVTVYRYFRYADYQVTVIDQIVTGQHKNEILGTKQLSCTYQKLVSGGMLLGQETQEGVYHKGYRYVEDSGIRVDTANNLVYRYFEPITYVLVLEGNGATDDSMTVKIDCEYGTSINLPANPFENRIRLTLDLQSEDANYTERSLLVDRTFAGWSLTADGKSAYADRACVQNIRDTSGTTTLYAAWDKTKYRFETKPSRMGYEFVGWATKPDASTGNMDIELSEDTTLYAVWKPDVVSYQVEYYKENIDGVFEKISAYRQQGYTDKEVSLQEVEDKYPGFYLDTAASKLAGVVQADGSLVLSAYYRRNTYTVHFDLQGGVCSKDYPEYTGKYESNIQIPEWTPTKDHCEFLGWTAEPDSGKLFCKAGESYHIPSYDQTLYAMWKPDTYQIKYQPEEGEQTSLLEKTYRYDESITLPDCTEAKTGYRFIGWSTTEGQTTGAVWTAGQMISSLFEKKDGTIVLYGVWKPIEGTLAFDKNFPKYEADIKGTIPSVYYQYDGDCYLLKQQYSLDGYEFAGWNTQKDGQGTTVLPGENIKNMFTTNEKMTLYAMWKPLTDTPFLVCLDKEGIDGTRQQEILRLHGQTDRSVKEEMLEQFPNTEPEKMIKGFIIENIEALNVPIQKDGSTIISLSLTRREYEVRIVLANDKSHLLYHISGKYEEKIVLPRALEAIGQVARYSSDAGTVCYPDRAFALTEDIVLYPEHTVQYYLPGETIATQYVWHGGYCQTYEPLEKGYYFDGWYQEEEHRNRICGAGEHIRIEQDTKLYGAWSKRVKSYSIRYDMGQYKGVEALEAFAATYTYGDTVRLPKAVQLLIPENYEFVGWYLQGDRTQSIVTEISEDSYGDKIYCLKLRQKDTLTETSAPVPTKEPTTSNTPDSSRVPMESLPPQGSGAPNPTTIPDRTPLPTQSVVPDQKDGESDPGDSLQGQSSLGLGSLTQKGNASTKGNTTVRAFVKANLQYRILSEKKKTVCVTGWKKKTTVLRIPNKVKYQGTTYRVTQIASRAFSNNRKLRKVVIGDQVRKIGAYAFCQNSKLRQVVIGKRVKVIASHAFYRDEKVQMIRFQTTTDVTIKQKAFSEMSRNAKAILKGKKKRILKKRLRKAGFQGKVIGS